MKVTQFERAKRSRHTSSSSCCSRTIPRANTAHDPKSKLLETGRAGLVFPEAASRIWRAGPRPQTSAIPRWRFSSMPASIAICASAPAARSRSTMSSAWRRAAIWKRSSSTSTTRWAIPPASPAGNASRLARPARSCRKRSWTRRAFRQRTRAVCRERLPLLWRRLPAHLSDQGRPHHCRRGRNGPSNQNRLCVKGRFGFDYVHHPDRLTKPLIRKDGVSKHDTAIDPADPLTHFREVSWDEALDRAAAWPSGRPRRPRRQARLRLRVRQRL